MSATNMASLEQMLLRAMQNTMKSVEAKALADMYEETGKFYTGGEPKVYQRTGALANTPRTTSPVSSGKSVEFTAYLDQSGGYSTGKRPSMSQVLTLAETGSSPGLRPAVGQKGFWDRATQKIEQDLYEAMSAAFS